MTDSADYFREAYQLSKIAHIKRTLYPMYSGMKVRLIYDHYKIDIGEILVYTGRNYKASSRSKYHSNNRYHFITLDGKTPICLYEWQFVPLDHHYEYDIGEVAIMFNGYDPCSSSNTSGGYFEKVEIVDSGYINSNDPLATKYSVKRIGRKRVHKVTAYNLSKLPILPYRYFYEFGKDPDVPIIAPYTHFPEN